MPNGKRRVQLTDEELAELRRLRALRREARAQPKPTAGQLVADWVAAGMGSWRFILIQTTLLIVWVTLNVAGWINAWDPYPFILLNLAFSTQAAYAAPLILLAQNRQENRDKVALEDDRRRAQQTKADTEFLARELAALRLAIGEVTTRDYLRRELEEIREMLATQQPPRQKGSKGQGPKRERAKGGSDADIRKIGEPE